MARPTTPLPDGDALGHAAERPLLEGFLPLSLTSPLPNPDFRTRITGVISGGPATGLRKTGSAILELTNANTYAGGTVVNG